MDETLNLTLKGALLLLVILLAVGLPRLGLAAQVRHLRQMRRRVLLEDALKYLLSSSYQEQQVTSHALAGALDISHARALNLVAEMESAGLITSHTSGLRLTPSGESWAVQVLRAHRLWERYLLDEARMPLQHLHREAERAEHRLSREELDALDAHLGYPRQDPHGDPIPTASGVVPASQSKSLLDFPLGEPAVIHHIEDEPAALFNEILEMGLRPGSLVRLIERGERQLKMEIDGQQVTLAPVVAASIQVAEAPPPEPEREALVPLTELPDGQQARIQEIDASCRGYTRRRLLDLGLTPGARISPELSNAFGDPRAYRVRGTLIALRKEQAQQVLVKPTNQTSTPRNGEEHALTQA